MLAIEPRRGVLFVCLHDAGRSQPAPGFLTSLTCGRVDVRSAGGLTTDKMNPAPVPAMS